MSDRFLNKKGQLGETMTWIVATLVILVLLALSLYAADFLAKAKSNPSSFFSLDYSKTDDILMDNSLFAYFNTKDSGIKSKIYEDLKKISEQDFLEDYDFDSKFEKLNLIFGER